MAEAAAQEGRHITPQSIKNDMVEYFWRGLSDRIKIRVETRPQDLDDAIIEARKVEQRIGIESKEDRIFVTREAPVINPEFMAKLEKLVQDQPAVAQEKPTCQICDKKGHVGKQCWRLIGAPNRARPNQDQPGRQQGGEGSVRMGQQRRGPRTCYTCGQVGHLRYNCPMNQQRPPSQQQNYPPQQEQGHPDIIGNRQPINPRQEQVAITEIMQKELQQFIENQQRTQQATLNEQKNEMWGQA